MEPSSFIGSTIFLYILAFIVVMAGFAYLTYRTSPKRKKRRDEKKNNRQ